ncbi:MAG: hypothetical protein AB1640_01995 [bacterium]
MQRRTAFPTCFLWRTRRRAVLFAALCAVLALWLRAEPSHAVSSFSAGTKEKKEPAALDLDQIWFYESDGRKVVPDLDPSWLSVVFRVEPPQVEGGGVEPLDQRALEAKTRRLIERHGGFEDFVCDTNLVEEGCFLKLDRPLEDEQLLERVRELDLDEEVQYAHPALRLQERTYGFFNAIRIEWKTGVESSGMEALLGQAGVWLDGEQVYRVDLFGLPLFKALNLLAEDIHVARASPVLVELKPSLRAALALGIHGAGIGDKIPFVFTVSFAENIQIEPGSLANLSLRPDNIQKELFEMQVDAYDYVNAVRTSPIRLTGWLKLYAPGEFVLPPIKLRYLCTTCSNTRERSLETERLRVRVASLLPSDRTRNTLLAPDDRLQPEDKEAFYRRAAWNRMLVALPALGLALLLAGWVLFSTRREAAKKRAAAERSPEEWLGGRLEALLATRPGAAHWTFVGEAGTLFRQILAERYGSGGKGAAGGTGPVFFDSIRRNLPGDMTDEVREILLEIDRVIALEMETYPGLDRFVERMRRTVSLPSRQQG